MTDEFPPAPRSRLRLMWDGVSSRTRTNLTVIVTVMVAVVMVLQAAMFIWAIRSSKRAAEFRRVETTAYQQHLSQLLDANHRDMQIHRCRQEDVHRAIADRVRATVPADPAPPTCPSEFTDAHR